DGARHGMEHHHVDVGGRHSRPTPRYPWGSYHCGTGWKHVAVRSPCRRESVARAIALSGLCSAFRRRLRLPRRQCRAGYVRCRTLRQTVTIPQPSLCLTHVRFVTAVGWTTWTSHGRRLRCYLGVEPPFGPTHRERRRACLFFSGI